MPTRILEHRAPPPAARRPSSSSLKSQSSSQSQPQPRPWQTPRSGSGSSSPPRDDDSDGENMQFTPCASQSHLALLDDDRDRGGVDENGENRNENVPPVRRVSFSQKPIYHSDSDDSERDAGHGHGHATDVDGGVDSDYESSDDEDEEDDLPSIHVEARLRADSRLLRDHAVRIVTSCLRANFPTLRAGFLVPEDVWRQVAHLDAEIERIYVSEAGKDEDEVVKVMEAMIHVHVYVASSAGALELGEESGIEDRDRADDDDDEKTTTAMVHCLPAIEFEGLWDHLIYDDDIKPRLLKYISSSMLFSESAVDYNVISWNRMVLLHGPPGTGKTSLCRALAQKLAIRMSTTFTSARLVEINSHSLFSKWFSESGKLVQKLFDAVHDMIANEQQLVVVMIDEVESLTSAREASGEPSDALRVVNALLTQLDKLKAHKNVLVMTTSNLAGKIDPAFLDRADLKQYVGLPPAGAIYWMLQECLSELGRAELAVGHAHLLDWATATSTTAHVPVGSKRAERGRKASLTLVDLARECHRNEFSGRFLRKVPLIAHARYLGGPARIDRWVTALRSAAADEGRARELLK